MGKRRFAALASIFLVLALTLGALAAPAQPVITIARLAGTVEVNHPKQTAGQWKAAKQGQTIGMGWKLRTGKGGKVQLTFPKNNTVILKENSVLYVDMLDDGGGGKIAADKGGLLVQLKNALTNGSQFQVETPAAMATVRGTEFAILVSRKDEASDTGAGNGQSASGYTTKGYGVNTRSDTPLPLDRARTINPEHKPTSDEAGKGSSRIKVKFHWDRDNKSDDSSWVRLVDLNTDGIPDIAIADVNGDGKLDQVVLTKTWTPDELQNLYLDGVKPTGHIGGDVNGPRGGITTPGPDVGMRQVADLDGDGLADIVVSGETTDQPLSRDGIKEVLARFPQKHPAKVEVPDLRLGYLQKQISDQAHGQGKLDDLASLADDGTLVLAAEAGSAGPGGGPYIGLADLTNAGVDPARMIISDPENGKPAPGGTGFTLQQIGDLDGDGHPDYMVVFNRGPRQTTSMDRRSDSAGDGVHTDSLPFNSLPENGAGGNAKDNNSPGGNAGSKNAAGVNGAAANHIILEGDLDGDGVPEPVDGIAVGDVNGDGLPDFVVSSAKFRAVRDWSNTQEKTKPDNGGGNPVVTPNTDSNGRSGQKEYNPTKNYAIGDSVVFSAALSKGTKGSQVGGDTGQDNAYQGIVVADLDGDGMPDILVSVIRDRNIFNDPPGSGSQSAGRLRDRNIFNDPSVTGDGAQGSRDKPRPRDVVVTNGPIPYERLKADMDGDGIVDVLDADCDGDGAAEIVVGDIDQDGDIDRAYPLADVDGDGVVDFVVLTGDTPGESLDKLKATHEIAMNSIRNMKARMAGGGADEQSGGSEGSSDVIIPPGPKGHFPSSHGDDPGTGGGGTSLPMGDLPPAQPPVVKRETSGSGGGASSGTVDEGNPDDSGRKSKTFQDKSDSDIVHFYGYVHTVEVSNDQGTQTLGEGETIDAQPGSPPSPPHPSGPEAQEFREVLKGFFEKGDKPTQDQFGNTIDSKQPRGGGIRLDDTPLDALIARAHELQTQADDFARKHQGQIGNIGSNPLYEQQAGGENPPFEGADKQSGGGGGAGKDHVYQYNATDLEFIAKINKTAGEVCDDGDALARDEQSAVSGSGAEAGGGGGAGGSTEMRKAGGDPHAILIGLLQEISGGLETLKTHFTVRATDAAGNVGSDTKAAGGGGGAGSSADWDFGNELRSSNNDMLAEDPGVVRDLLAHFDKWSELLNALSALAVTVDKIKFKQEFGPSQPSKRTAETGALPDLGSYDDRLTQLVERAHQAALQLTETNAAGDSSASNRDGRGFTSNNVHHNTQALQEIAGSGQTLAAEEQGAFETRGDVSKGSNDAGMLSTRIRGLQTSSGGGGGAGKEQEEGFGKDLGNDQVQGILIGLLRQISGDMASLQSQLKTASGTGTQGNSGGGGAGKSYNYRSTFKGKQGTVGSAKRTIGGGGGGSGGALDDDTSARLEDHLDKWSDLANTLSLCLNVMQAAGSLPRAASELPELKWMAPELLGGYVAPLDQLSGQTNNMRSRLNALEAKLTALGLVGDNVRGNSGGVGAVVNPNDPNSAAQGSGGSGGAGDNELPAVQDELERWQGVLEEQYGQLNLLASAELAQIQMVDTSSVGTDSTGADAVQLNHHGSSTSSNQRITSGQPKIIDNNKGLLVSFFTEIKLRYPATQGTSGQAKRTTGPPSVPQLEDDPSNDGLPQHLQEWVSLLNQLDELNVVVGNFVGTVASANSAVTARREIPPPVVDWSPFEQQLTAIDRQLDQVQTGDLNGDAQVVQIMNALQPLVDAANALGSTRDDFLPAVQKYANSYAMYGIMKGARMSSANHVSEVNVRLWDPQNPREIVGQPHSGAGLGDDNGGHAGSGSSSGDPGATSDQTGRITKPGMDKLSALAPKSSAAQDFIKQVANTVDAEYARGPRQTIPLDSTVAPSGDSKLNKDYSTDPYVEDAQRSYDTDPYSEDLLRLLGHFVTVFDRLDDLDQQLGRVTVRGWDPQKKQEIVGTARDFDRLADEWDRYETHDQTTQMLFLWKQVLELHDKLHDSYDESCRYLGMKAKEKGNRAMHSTTIDTMEPAVLELTTGEAELESVEVPAVQNNLLPALQDNLLPAVQRTLADMSQTDATVIEMHNRMEKMQDDISPLISDNEDLLDKLNGLIDPGDPVLGLRNNNIDTDNDGLSDVDEVALGLDPLEHNDGFIELVSPEDGATFSRGTDNAIDFEYQPLDTDQRVEYTLVLTSDGQQFTRQHARQHERVPMEQFTGPGGAFQDTDGDGKIDVTWHIEGRYAQNGGVVVHFSSEERHFTIEGPPTGQHVIIDLSNASNIQRVGGDIVIRASISQVDALGQWDIRVAYDQADLAFKSGRKLGIFAPATVFFSDQGGVIEISGTAPRGSAGVSGEGEIFELHFSALKQDDTIVEGNDLSLVDTAGQPIDAEFGTQADVSITK